MKHGSIIERVLAGLENAIPGEFTSEIRENIRTSLQSVIAEMDLVTRDEFEIQQKMLDKAIARVNALEEKLDSSKKP